MRPENAASRAVLAKVGFREEGLLRRYLEVDRAWRDHLLMAITVEEVYGSVASTRCSMTGPKQWSRPNANAPVATPPPVAALGTQ